MIVEGFKKFVSKISSDDANIKFDGLYELYKSDPAFKVTMWDQRGSVDFEQWAPVVQLKSLLGLRKFSAKKASHFRKVDSKQSSLRDYLQIDSNDMPLFEKFENQKSYLDHHQDFNVRNVDMLNDHLVLSDLLRINSTNDQLAFIKLKNNILSVEQCETVDEVINKNKRIDVIFFIVSVGDFCDKSREKYGSISLLQWKQLMHDDSFKSCPVILVFTKSDLLSSPSPSPTTCNSRNSIFSSNLDSCTITEDEIKFPKPFFEDDSGANIKLNNALFLKLNTSLVSTSYMVASNTSFTSTSSTSSLDSTSPCIVEGIEILSPTTDSNEEKPKPLSKKNSNPVLTSLDSPRLKISLSPRERSNSSPRENLKLPKSKNKILQLLMSHFLDDESVSQGRKIQIADDCIVTCKLDEETPGRLFNILDKHIPQLKTTRFAIFGTGSCSKSTIHNQMLKIVQSENLPQLSPPLMFSYYVKTLALAWKTLIELVQKNKQDKAFEDITSDRKKKPSLTTSFLLTLPEKKDESKSTVSNQDLISDSTSLDPLLTNRETPRSIILQRTERTRKHSALTDRLTLLGEEFKTAYAWCLKVLDSDLTFALNCLGKDIVGNLLDIWKQDQVQCVWNREYLSYHLSSIGNLKALMDHIEIASTGTNIDFSTFLKTYTTANGLMTDIFFLRGQKCSVTVTRGSKWKYIQQWSFAYNCSFDVIFYFVNLANYDLNDQHPEEQNEELKPDDALGEKSNSFKNSPVQSLYESIVHFEQILEIYGFLNYENKPETLLTRKDLRRNKPSHSPISSLLTKIYSWKRRQKIVILLLQTCCLEGTVLHYKPTFLIHKKHMIYKI